MRWYCEDCDGHCELIVPTDIEPSICPFDLDECDWKWKIEDEV